MTTPPRLLSLSLSALLLAACAGTKENGLVVVNTDPSVVINSPSDGAVFDERKSITFVATVADNQDPEDALEITWTVDNGVAEAGDFTAIDGKTTFVTANLQPGSHSVSVRATDTGGKTATFAVGVTITDLPEAPEIVFVRPIEGEEVLEGEEFSFGAQVSDAFDAPEDLTVTFATDQAEGTFCTPVVDPAGLATCAYTLAPGRHLLTWTVTDTEGQSAEATRYFEVIDLDDDDGDGDGMTENEGDCNDADPAIFADAEEIYNGIDDDCDLLIDEGTVNYDDDGDTYTELMADCDDTDPTVYPGAPEEPDTVDDDCDGVIDEGTALYDDDGDGWTEAEGDCDDSCFACNLSASEIEDALDNDCDGVVDEGTAAYDDDGDGYTEYMDDCDDSDPLVSPAGLETCGDGVDNDCDGSADEANASGCEAYYMDTDGDGFGTTSSRCLCAPTGYYTSPYNTDCYDGNANANTSNTAWYTTDRGDSSYDYDCDGAQTKYYSSKYSCDAWPLCGSALGSFSAGWKTSVAACGASATYVTACSIGTTSCTLTTVTRTQKCQ